MLRIDHADDTVFVPVRYGPARIFVFQHHLKHFRHVHISGNSRDFFSRDHDFLGDPIIKIKNFIHKCIFRRIDFSVFKLSDSRIRGSSSEWEPSCSDAGFNPAKPVRILAEPFSTQINGNMNT